MGAVMGFASLMTRLQLWVQRVLLPLCDPGERCANTAVSHLCTHCFPLPYAPQRGKGRGDCAHTPRVSQHPLWAVLRSSISFWLHVFMLLKPVIKTLFSLFLCLLGISCGYVNLYVLLAFAGRLTVQMSWLCWCWGCRILLYPDPLPRLGGRSCHIASAADPLSPSATGAASVQPS